MKREEAKELFKSDIDAYGKPRHVMKNIDKIYDEFEAEHPLPPAEGARKVQWSGYGELGNISQKPLQPTAEDAEEIDDETIAYAAEHQCGTPFSERWIGFVKGAKWHRSLHAQQIVEKMVEEKLKNAPKNCPKAAQCAHVEGGLKCPPNVICPI